MNVHVLLSHLGSVSKSGDGWLARCPAHDDRSPSLSIATGEKGGIVLHCHAGCSPEDVVCALGFAMKDLAPETDRSSKQRSQIVTTYQYQDEVGKLLFEVVRFHPKDFRQRRPDPTTADGWNWSVKGIRRVPYRLPDLLAGVKSGLKAFICEGEKDCLAMIEAGFVATCNPGGAGKWRSEYSASFAGADVVVIADRDEPGRRHAQDVASKLQPLARSLQVIELPDVNGKRVKDAADFLSAGGTREGIKEIAESAPQWSPGPESINPSERSKILLPGDNRTISAFAREVALALQGTELFNHGGVVMRLNWRRDGLETMTADCFRTWTEQHLLCVKADTEAIRTMSKEVAGTVLASSQFYSALPRIERINSIRLPVTRADGSILLLPQGYDAATYTYTLDTCTYREDMSTADARAAIADLYDEFPFVPGNERSRAVAISALISLYSGGLLPGGSLRPIFISLANDVGAGKTTLWRLVLLIVCGSATLTSRPKDEDEVRKALLAVVMQAASYLFIDNLKGHLSSPALESFVTTDTWRDRVLGASRMFSGDNKATVFITGNGLTISPDIARRCLITELFQELERPQDKVFRRTLDNPTIARLRPDVLAACWSLVRAWNEAGRPKPSRPNSSFPQWAEVVGGIVEHAGFGCCLEPHLAEMGGDTDAEEVRTLVGRLACQSGWHRFTDVVSLAVESGLFGLEPEDWADDRKKQGVRRQVGHILRRNAGKVFSLAEGRCRLEARGKGRSTEYRVSHERDKIGAIGAIGAGAFDLDAHPPTDSCTDVTDCTDPTPALGNRTPGFSDPSWRQCGIPD